jgi:putative ABC transport system permease protein
MPLKLAFRNVKKSMRDYLIYFLTLSFGVCIFYAFNSIESQQAVMAATSGQMAALRVLGRIMGTFSVFVSVILAFLILYANGFLIKRRKKEFGLYMILGMEKRMTARILLFETLFVGALSLFAGLLIGAFLSQGMAVVTARLLGAGIGSFRFVFSFPALVKTMCYFGLAFALALLFNVVTVRRQKLINLLYASKKNEYFKMPRPGLSVLLFVLSICCIGVAYTLVMDGGILMVSGVLSFCVALGAVGTFLFFFSLSGFFLRLVQRNKKLYLKNLNMFVLRQVSSKINTAYVTMTLVCLMLFLSISALSSGLGLSGALSADLRESAPFDATYSVWAKDDGAYAGIDSAAVLRERGVDPDVFAADYATARYYDADASFTLRAGGKEETVRPNFMKLSDYNAVLALRGLAPISLGADEYAINAAAPTGKLREALAAYAEIGGGLTLAEQNLRTDASKIYAHTLEVATNKDTAIVAIVPDALLSNAPVNRDFLHLNYPQGDDASEKRFLSAMFDFAPDGLEGRFETKVRVLEYSRSTTTTIAYIAIYLGVVSLLMAATVLAIGQLSEAGDNADRYGLLRKIGAEDRMINAALFMQILICFGAPALLALVHAAVGIRVASDFVNLLGEMNIVGGSLVAAFAIVSVYCVYFFATYIGSKRIVNKEYMHLRRQE